MKHINTGNCEKCEEIFNTYPNFHVGLKQWFKDLQKKNPECHISQAGRGEKDQNLYYKQGKSKAKWTQSSHNYNMAIDIFKLNVTMGAEWPKDWFDSVINSAVDSHNHSTTKDFEIKWYGKPGSPFFELPHCEVSNWKTISDKKLVE